MALQQTIDDSPHRCSCCFVCANLYPVSWTPLPCALLKHVTNVRCDSLSQVLQRLPLQYFNHRPRPFWQGANTAKNGRKLPKELFAVNFGKVKFCLKLRIFLITNNHMAVCAN